MHHGLLRGGGQAVHGRGPGRAWPHAATPTATPGIAGQLFGHVQGQAGQLGTELGAVSAGYEALLVFLGDDIDPIILLIEDMNDLKGQRRFAEWG